MLGAKALNIKLCIEVIDGKMIVGKKFIRMPILMRLLKHMRAARYPATAGLTRSEFYLNAEKGKTVLAE